MMALMWMEPRCDAMTTLSDDNPSYGVVETYRRRGECHQTGPGMFARSIATARANAIKSGWVIIDDLWLCPACAGKETRD